MGSAYLRKVLVNTAGCTAPPREFCRMSFYLPLVLLALPTFDLRELLEYPLIRQFSHVQVWFLLLLAFHVPQFQLVRVCPYATVYKQF